LANSCYLDADRTGSPGHLRSLPAGRLQAGHNIAAILLASTMRLAHAPRGIRQGRPMTFAPANFDPSIDPTADQVRALRDAGPDGPVVMLNLLKFRVHASYPAGSPHAPCSGADALPQVPDGIRRNGG
jgi:hypothetical protein